MALGTALSTAWPTLLDFARRIDPDGKIAKVAEILNKYNEILDDMPFIEGNLPTGHKTTLRGSIPTPTWRLLNRGVVPVKSTSNQIIETCGMLEAYSEIDKDLAMLNGNTADFRLSEDVAVIEGMGQAVATALIYGDVSVNPEQFTGLSPRYYAVSGSTTATNVIDAGGTGSANTSIWLVGWSDQTVHGIFPKGSQAGLKFADLGEQTIYDGQTFPGAGRYQAFRSHYQQKVGLSVRDWRFVVRIANIDVTALATAGDTSDTSANLFKFMSMALDKFPPVGSVRPVFYMNQTVRSYLRVKLISKSNVWLDLTDMKGASGISRPTLNFQGVPCRRVDAILNTEARVTT
jgi:hypothetical protein